MIFLDQYKIENATNIDDDPCFAMPEIYPNFQSEMMRFKQLLIDLVEEGKPKTFYKFGDGDYYFLKKQPVGSATPGKRALSKNYNDIKHEEFVSGVEKNDFITCELYPRNRAKFIELYPNKKIDFPAEYGYGLVANRWLTRQFAGKIGLIGAHDKINLIQSMMSVTEYQEYLGLEKFTDYIRIPQKYACDDIDATEKMIAEQLEKSNSKIFLLGIGHVKSALLHRLKNYSDSVFLDVGTGIDALAGIIDHGRPYMGDWINHRISGFNYGLLDILQYNIWNTPHRVLKGNLV